MSFMRLGTMTRRRFAACLVWALAGVFCCGAFAPASAQELLLTNLVLNNYEGRIRVRFGIEPTGLERIAQALDAGERLSLRCRARVRPPTRISVRFFAGILAKSSSILAPGTDWNAA